MSIHREHNVFEQEVYTYLSENQFKIEESTYHKVYDSESRQLLQNRWSMTALYLRGRADRVAIHKILPLEFEFECKTHDDKNRHDMLLEALPLAHHINKLRLGVDCLYAYRNPHLNFECGFWISTRPPIRVVMMPYRKEYVPIRQFLHESFQYFFPGVKIVDLKSCRGSKDPFVIIDRSEVEKLPSWRALIKKCGVQGKATIVKTVRGTQITK